MRHYRKAVRVQPLGSGDHFFDWGAFDVGYVDAGACGQQRFEIFNLFCRAWHYLTRVALKERFHLDGGRCGGKGVTGSIGRGGAASIGAGWTASDAGAGSAGGRGGSVEPPRKNGEIGRVPGGGTASGDGSTSPVPGRHSRPKRRAASVRRTGGAPGRSSS